MYSKGHSVKTKTSERNRGRGREREGAFGMQACQYCLHTQTQTHK